VEQDIKLIHLGADLLPKGSCMLERQKDFIKKYLKNFYQRCQNKGISVLATFGNDDVWSRKPYFKKYADLLDEKPFEMGGFEFKSYPYVQDYPFGLKTACKLDFEGWTCPDKYISNPVDLSPTGGLQRIEEDIAEYFGKKGTIEEDLKKIPVSNKTIMAIHQPPWSLSLDVCLGGRRVGSKAVYDWIEKTKPKLVLCGHIHESYQITGIWKGYIGKTLVIQPGQERDKVHLVYIELQGDSVKAELII
jgi:Icc-related predicted phosphoesterase